MAKIDEVVFVEGVLQEELDLFVRQLSLAEVDLLESLSRLVHVQLARVIRVHLLEALHHRLGSATPGGRVLLRVCILLSTIIITINNSITPYAYIRIQPFHNRI